MQKDWTYCQRLPIRAENEKKKYARKNGHRKEKQRTGFWR